ncbi:hypothetical protein [Arthrobacter sp. Rue61a]|uniref:hypothetical protein n=1 Tax=Arthrobacter sp. Rue61a TaxID=1118963 RepID=UPI00027DF49B|nr:hypothetical protein [Arthrobacter sp. Rue61a]AFR31404.1 hypothetical protein ARUE_232p01960 [Arthrobacter sp. Rue61a]
MPADEILFWYMMLSALGILAIAALNPLEAPVGVFRSFAAPLSHFARTPTAEPAPSFAGPQMHEVRPEIAAQGHRISAVLATGKSLTQQRI